MSRGVVHQINVSAGGVPKLPIPEGVVKKTGLVGDAQAKPGIHGGPTRAVSLYSLERIQALAAEGHPIAPGAAGENLTLVGVDFSQLEPGMRLRLGAGVELEITSYAEPCRTIRGCFSDGVFRRLSQVAHPGHARLYCEVLREGVIRPGDAVEVSPGALHEPAPALTASRPITSKETSMIALKLAYANLYVSDLARSVDFFANTLGLPVQYSDASFGYASLDAGPVRMGIAQVDTQDADQRANVGRMTGLGFGVPDLKAAFAELERKGVTFPMKPSKQPWGGFMALFSDPDGNTFYLDELP
jgi:MOSC domain-containing protein YiiM